jgi:hypothetical protein
MKGLFLALVLLGIGFVAEAQVLHQKVENVTLKDLSGEAVELPYFGEKNLFIFYIDPDTALSSFGGHANYKFSDEIEKRKVSSGPNLFGFGILNIGDTGLPKKIVRNQARKRTANNGGLVLEDPDNTLSRAWGLGDCNGKYVFIVVSKEGEIVHFQKEKVTEADKEALYETLAKYK